MIAVQTERWLSRVEASLVHKTVSRHKRPHLETVTQEAKAKQNKINY